MRKDTPFPQGNSPMTDFLKKAWSSGWLDEFADEHLLIRIIENRLDDFVGRVQLSANNLAMYCPMDANGGYDLASFSSTFCINLSVRLAHMANAFGENSIKHFITDQLSAGKLNHYNEDTFLQALSEISILTFWLGRWPWNQTIYEPRVKSGENNKNPEASFIYHLKPSENTTPKTIKINIEVKTPEFAHDNHESESILIPSVLLTEHGRSLVQNFCKTNEVTYLPPRVWKLVQFINSAASKFSEPKENELNLLYINWSYRDYPSNSFLEAASLLSNQYNGLLNYPNIAKELDVQPDAFNKISAIIVYTDSLEGVMFTDFRHVWQSNGAGPRFRMYTLDRNIVQNVCNDTREFVFQLTGMNPCDQENCKALIAPKSATEKDLQRVTELGQAYGALMTGDVILQGKILTQHNIE